MVGSSSRGSYRVAWYCPYSSSNVSSALARNSPLNHLGQGRRIRRQVDVRARSR